MSNKDAVDRIVAVTNSLQTLQITASYGNVTTLSGCLELLKDVAAGLAAEQSETTT